MELIDIVCIIFLCVWLLLGFRRGVLFEILTIFIATVAALIAYFVHPTLVDIAGRFLNSSINLERIVFLVSFVVVLVIIQMLANRMISNLGEMTEKMVVFKILGSAVAIFRGAFYLGVLLWLIVSFAPNSALTARINNAVVPNYMKNVVNVVYNKMDDIVRKGHIGPFTVREILK